MCLCVCLVPECPGNIFCLFVLFYLSDYPYLFLYLFVYPFVYPFVYLFVSLLIFCIHHIFALMCSKFLSIYSSLFYLFTCSSGFFVWCSTVHLSVCCVHMPKCPAIYLSINQSVHLSTSPPVNLLICHSVFVCLSVTASVLLPLAFSSLPLFWSVYLFFCLCFCQFLSLTQSLSLPTCLSVLLIPCLSAFYILLLVPPPPPQSTTNNQQTTTNNKPLQHLQQQTFISFVCTLVQLPFFFFSKFIIIIIIVAFTTSAHIYKYMLKNIFKINIHIPQPRSLTHFVRGGGGIV